MEKNIKRIGLLTSGGDAPGMNAAIRSVVRKSICENIQVFGILRGYEGLVNNEVIKIDRRDVSNILGRGGTVLKTARSKEFMTTEGQEKAVNTIKANNLDALVVIGGNGSMQGAQVLEKEWDIRTVGVPGTIDNDLGNTDYTIGCHTSVDTVLSAIDKIRDTVVSMERIYVIEVMGRKEPYIAIMAGLAGGAEEILYPGMSMEIDQMAEEIEKAEAKGKRSWIIIVSEGFASANEITEKLRAKTGKSVRSVILGHIQRGGAPNAPDRILASRMGAFSVQALIEGHRGEMVGVRSNNLVLIPYEAACFERDKDEKLNKELYDLTKLLAI